MAHSTATRTTLKYISLIFLFKKTVILRVIAHDIKIRSVVVSHQVCNISETKKNITYTHIVVKEGALMEHFIGQCAPSRDSVTELRSLLHNAPNYLLGCVIQKRL